MGKSKAAKVQVPECRYGAACTRRDCIFRHPPKPAKQQQAPPPKEKSDRVCFAFVAGRCAFGRLCHDKHPDDSSCRTIRERYSRIECQWGRGCRTEGCLYMHPSDEPAGPAMPAPPPRPQPAVFAEGPRIVPQQAFSEESRQRDGPPSQVQIPRAVVQAADLRDPSAFEIPDPLERFLAVNAHNSGTQSAALLDLHFQSVQSFPAVLDDVLPERLRMFPDDGVWVLTGAAAARGQAQGQGLYEAVHAYLLRNRFDFAIGQSGEGVQGAFFVRGRKKQQDPLEGVKAVFLCGLPGSGKTAVAEALGKKSGRFVLVAPDVLGGGGAACEEPFRQALAEAAKGGTKDGREKPKSAWWWEHAFSPERLYLAVCLRTPALAWIQEACGLTLPRAGFLHAMLAYQPTALDLRRHLGRPCRVTFRCHLVLEGTAAPHTGELFEVLLCTALSAEGGGKARPVPLHITLAGPRAAARHLQVLNAVAPDKRIMANTLIGGFKVRHVGELDGGKEVLGLGLLMNKSGDHRDAPAPVSFDVRCLLGASGATSAGSPAASGAAAGPSAREWTHVGDAALASLDPLVVLEEVGGESEHDWRQALSTRCAKLGFKAPAVQISRPMGSTEAKTVQWGRLRPSCLLHCAADEAVVSSLLREGTAALRSNGVVAMPPHPDSNDSRALPPVVILDRPNLQVAERRRWMQLGGLQRGEAVALHMDVPELECAGRLMRRGGRTPSAEDTEAAAELPRLAAILEPPTEREGFRAVVRLRGSAAATQELVRRWTEDRPAERPGAETHAAAGQSGEDAEAPAPALPRLKEWIEVEEQGGRRSVWGVPLGCPVDVPLAASLEGVLDAAEPGYEDEAFVQGGHGPEQGERRLGTAWQAAGAGSAPAPEAAGQAQQDEDPEERARQEQLAATLRCMGFDDEPSLHAALRAGGGNLNVAVESMLQSRGSAS